jgi:hypothetical protein
MSREWISEGEVRDATPARGFASPDGHRFVLGQPIESDYRGRWDATDQTRAPVRDPQIGPAHRTAVPAAAG